MKNILCYGDSNTWGFVPGTAERYSFDGRWTGVLQNELIDNYKIWEDGISGRTTVWDDPFTLSRNGLKGLGYALLRAKPVDLVVVMLGTNDLYYTNAYGYYRGIKRFAQRVLDASAYYPDSSSIFRDEPKLLLISPVTLHPDIGVIRPELQLKRRYLDSCQFAKYTEMVAMELKSCWMDAAEYAEASGVDGIHLTADSHQRLGRAVAQMIKKII